MIYIFTGWLADEYFVVVVLHFGLCAQEYHVPCTMYRRHYPLCRLEDWQHHPPGKVLQLYPLFLARIQLFDPHYPDQAQLFFFPEKRPFSYPVVEGEMVVSDAWLFEHPKKSGQDLEQRRNCSRVLAAFCRMQCTFCDCDLSPSLCKFVFKLSRKYWKHVGGKFCWTCHI